MGASMNRHSWNTNSSSPLCRFADAQALVGVWLVMYLLVSPIFLSVLYVGYKQWKKQPGLSHSDAFTFHIIPMEILTIAGSFVYAFADTFRVQMNVGNLLYNTAISGQIFIHALTSVERYLAVVHPITYLRFKKSGGVRIRNISIAVVWILSVGLRSFVNALNDIHFDVMLNISLVFIVCAVVTFCSISVLFALIRPGPGEGGRALKRIDKSKQRAFFTIIVIQGVLLVRLVLFVVECLLDMLKPFEQDKFCMLVTSVAILNFPSSLVLPLMFLHKSRKLPNCSNLNCKVQLKNK